MRNVYVRRVLFYGSGHRHRNFDISRMFLLQVWFDGMTTSMCCDKKTLIEDYTNPDKGFKFTVDAHMDVSNLIFPSVYIVTDVNTFRPQSEQFKLAYYKAGVYKQRIMSRKELINWANKIEHRSMLAKTYTVPYEDLLLESKL
jgi:hypothetical protein